MVKFVIFQDVETLVWKLDTKYFIDFRLWERMKPKNINLWLISKASKIFEIADQKFPRPTIF